MTSVTSVADLEILYRRAHRRVVKLWGKASLHPCIRCGERAKDWAYDGTDPTDPGEAGERWRYSSWPEFYMPMCHRCHMGRDRDLRGVWQEMPAQLIGVPPCNHPEGCPEPVYRDRLCKLHYGRRLRYKGLGPVGRIGKHMPFDDRFINNIQVNGPLPQSSPILSAREAFLLGPCSEWTGYVHASGFGAIWRGHRLLYVHRVAWERTHGPIPVGVMIYQKCGNRLCVRFDHLRAA